jgi:hypothetical protein
MRQGMKRVNVVNEEAGQASKLQMFWLGYLLSRGTEIGRQCVKRRST